jgi:uncharacterized protein (DUF433 family)
VNSRVSLESIIFAFLDGLSPETIATEGFPTLTLEQVYGAITYYLANRVALDTNLKQTEQNYEVLREETRKTDPSFHNKLLQTRQNILVKS